jgi:YVTN family beta-propeller protein
MVRFLPLLALICVVTLPGCAEVEMEVVEAPAPNYEVWAMDQGTHKLYVYGRELGEPEVVDLAPHGIRVPHMLHFTSDQTYGFVAAVGSGQTAVIRGDDRTVVGVIETGPRTHMATVAPDDRSVLVAVIGSPERRWDGELVELTVDPAGERWEPGRRLVIAEDPLFRARRNEFRDSGPVCSYFTADGRYAYVTLGPMVDDGGVVVLDTETFSLVAVHPPGEVPANCGTLLTPDGSRMLVNAGHHDVGEWFAFDTDTHELIHRESSRGIDAHGVWATPDGGEIWMVNRVSDNAIVIDPATLEIVAEIESVGITPDIIAMSPDSRYAFMSLRGPEPVTMPHVAEGETPGFSVVEIPSRRLVRVVEPDPGNRASDFHGIAVRVIP